MLARERAKAEFQDWEKKEEEVYFSLYFINYCGSDVISA
jgi:hypothetical protein